MLTIQKTRQWRSSRHTTKQPWPGYQPYRSLSSHGLQIDSAFSGFNWLVGSGLGKRRRLFLKERSCIGQPWCLPPRPTPSRGQMGQQADTILTLPSPSWALHASCSGVRQASVLLGMFAWLCAPGLMGPWMVVSGAGGVDEGVGKESIRGHPQISKHQPAQEGTSRSPPLYS